MTDLDPFSLGGVIDGDETIVDHEGQDALALVVDEPTLGTLVRELFEANECFGNTKANDPRFDERLSRAIELDNQIAACPAQTIGGLAWRLLDLNRVIQDEEGVSEWTRAAMQMACNDAARLAQSLRKTNC